MILFSSSPQVYEILIKQQEIAQHKYLTLLYSSDFYNLHVDHIKQVSITGKQLEIYKHINAI
jgi:hypothetical protein